MCSLAWAKLTAAAEVRVNGRSHAYEFQRINIELFTQQRDTIMTSSEREFV